MKRLKKKRKLERVRVREGRGMANFKLLESKYRKLYKDPSFQGHCLGGRIEKGTKMKFLAKRTRIGESDARREWRN